MSSLHFAAYVDGNARSELSGAACTAGQEGAYTCESPLPPLSNGTHSLELVAWVEVNGEVLESVRSPALTLQVINGAAASTAVASIGAASDPTAAPGDASHGPSGCGVVSVSNRNVIVWDATGGVRLVNPWTARSRPVTWRIPADESWEIAGLAADPQFAENGWVYVAQTDAGDGPALRVVRYRLAGDVLGERAVLFQNTLTARPARVRLSVGPGDHLSVALLTGSAGAGPHPFLIRLTTDGRISADNPSGSVFADVVATQPLDIAWPANGNPWVVEKIRQGTYALLLIRDGGSRLAASFSTTSPPVALQPARTGAQPAGWIVLGNGQILGLIDSAEVWNVTADQAVTPTPGVIGDAVLVGDREMVACGPTNGTGGADTPRYRIWRVELRD